MPSSRFPIPQGTLDMLILQPVYPVLHGLDQKGWLKPIGSNRKPDVQLILDEGGAQ